MTKRPPEWVVKALNRFCRRASDPVLPTSKALSRDGREVDTLNTQAEVEIALNLTHFAQRILTEAETDPLGAKLLEIGPGSNLAHALHLSSQGVKITLVDRFPTEWNESFHKPVYEAFLEAVGEPSPFVEGALTGEEHSRLHIIAEAAENLASLPDDEFDGCMSNAVLEHVFNFHAVAKEIFRITRPGGAHGHQVDFRDHRDFGRPLEFLTIPDDEWDANFAELSYVQGNRVRPCEAEDAFRAAGFTIALKFPNTIADDLYIDDVAQRIPPDSRFSKWPKEEFGPGGVLYFLRRPFE